MGYRSIMAFLVLAGMAGGAKAADWSPDQYAYESADETIILRGSIGVIGIEGEETVFIAPGYDERLSYLTWRTVAPMVAASLGVRLPDGWTLKGEARAAMAGVGQMEDYDWLWPHRPGFGPDQWTDRSVSPHTNLDWYLDGAIAFGRDLVSDGDMRVNFNGGFKYTDVQWTAIGGTAVYSVGGFRDTSLVFPDTPAITYRQQLPTLFAGLDVESREGDWAYAASAKGGITTFGRATDDHWLSAVNYVDAFRPAPMVSLNASASYNFSRNAGFFVEGGVEKVWLLRGDTTMTGMLAGYSVDTAGGALGTLSLSAGLKGSF